MILAGSLAIAFLAGILSVLSPCVLPILPIVLGSAVSAHRFGPLALAAGLTLSFTALGLFVATIGVSIGLGGGSFQLVTAGFFVLVGIVLLVPQLQTRIAAALGPLGNWVEQHFHRFTPTGLMGQFGLGLLFGAVWSPCSGPTLGAAALMAAGGHDLAEASLTMLAFGVGAALPLLALGAISRTTFARWRAQIGTTSRGAKMVLGGSLFFLGILILTGANRTIESLLVANSPDWLLQLTTRY